MDQSLEHLHSKFVLIVILDIKRLLTRETNQTPSTNLLQFHTLWLAIKEYRPNFENRFELILYRYRRIVLAYVIQRNIEHRIHFVSNVWVDRGYEAENTEIRK